MNSKTYSLTHCSALVLMLFLAGTSLETYSMNYPKSGSAAVFIWTPQEAFVATDSKQTDPEHPGRFEQACKILVIPRFAFASTGFSELRAVGFDVKAIAEEVGNKVGTPQCVVDSFEKLLAPKLEVALEFARVHVPVIYMRQYRNTVVMNGLFAFPTDPPTVIVTRFRSNDSNGSIRLQRQRYECPGSECDPQLEWNAYGHVEGLHQFLAKKPDFFKTHKPAVAAREMIQAAIDSMPEYVGPPVRVVRVGKGDISWLDGSTTCR